MLSSIATGGRALSARIVKWWKDYRERRACLEELRYDDPEIDRIARDASISPWQLRKLVRSGPGGADLLPSRLAGLHLDSESVSRAEPDVMRDLQRVCTLCDSKRRCAYDLATDPEDPKWRGYCPNAPTLDALSAEGGAASRRVDRKEKSVGPRGEHT